MSVEPKAKNKDAEAKVAAFGSDAAPIVYFDGAVAFGLVNGIVQIELGATVRIPVTVGGKEEVRSRVIVTAHLRADEASMAQLAEAIAKARALREKKDAG